MCAYSDQCPHGHGHIRPFHTYVCPSTVCWQELVEASQTLINSAVTSPEGDGRRLLADYDIDPTHATYFTYLT